MSGKLESPLVFLIAMGREELGQVVTPQQQQAVDDDTRERIEVLIAPLELCTDNAAMAAIAGDLLASGRVAGLDADVLPGLVRHRPPSGLPAR